MSVGRAAFVAQTEGEVTPGAVTVAKSILGIVAAAGKGLKITEIGVEFIGVVAAAKPVLVELCTADGTTGGTATSVTPRPRSIPQAQTTDSSAKKNYTVEPTVLVPVREWLVHPQAPLIIQFPLGREPQATNLGGYVIRETFASGETVVNTRAYLEFEE